jgi:hypothetical protein
MVISGVSQVVRKKKRKKNDSDDHVHPFFPSLPSKFRRDGGHLRAHVSAVLVECLKCDARTVSNSSQRTITSQDGIYLIKETGKLLEFSVERLLVRPRLYGVEDLIRHTRDVLGDVELEDGELFVFGLC